MSVSRYLFVQVVKRLRAFWGVNGLGRIVKRFFRAILSWNYSLLGFQTCWFHFWDHFTLLSSTCMTSDFRRHWRRVAIRESGCALDRALLQLIRVAHKFVCKFISFFKQIYPELKALEVDDVFSVAGHHSLPPIGQRVHPVLPELGGARLNPFIQCLLKIVRNFELASDQEVL